MSPQHTVHFQLRPSPKRLLSVCSGPPSTLPACRTFKYVTLVLAAVLARSNLNLKYIVLLEHSNYDMVFGRFLGSVAIVIQTRNGRFGRTRTQTCSNFKAFSAPSAGKTGTREMGRICGSTIAFPGHNRISNTCTLLIKLSFFSWASYRGLYKLLNGTTGMSE